MPTVKGCQDRTASHVERWYRADQGRATTALATMARRSIQRQRLISSVGQRRSRSIRAVCVYLAFQVIYLKSSAPSGTARCAGDLNDCRVSGELNVGRFSWTRKSAAGGISLSTRGHFVIKAIDLLLGVLRALVPGPARRAQARHRIELHQPLRDCPFAERARELAQVTARTPRLPILISASIAVTRSLRDRLPT